MKRNISGHWWGRQPSTFQEKEFWFEQVVELNNTPKKFIKKELYLYFREWWHSAIRSVLDTVNVNSEYKILADKLYNKVTAKQVQESIGLLSRFELIKKNDAGYWKPTDKVISTADNIKDECLRHYQLTNLSILRQILEEGKPGSHDSSLVTVSVTQKGLTRIINRIRQLRSEIISIAHKDEGIAERVYQIAVHAYPISKKD